ncbi:hypothetical protein pb186bvf_017791 [Paramecium bursaria]
MYRSSFYESDQKDIVLAQLKADLFEAQRQNEELLLIQEEIRKLELKIKLAQDEKSIIEQEHRMRHEQALRQINSLKSEAQELQGYLQDKHIDQDKNFQQREQLAELNDQRQLELQQARREYNRLQDQVHSEADYLKVLQEKQRAFEIDAKIQQNRNNDLQQKIDEYRSLQQEKELQLNNLQQKLSKLQQNISDGDNQSQQQQIQEIQQEIKQIDQAHYENKQQSKQIEIQILKLEDEAQYLSLEAQKLKQSIALEQQKKNDIQKKVAKSKGLLQKKDEYQEQIENELNKTKRIGNYYQKHIEVLMQANQELVSELENYNQDDQKVRQIINRTDRVKQLQLRVSSGSRALRGSGQKY